MLTKVQIQYLKFELYESFKVFLPAETVDWQAQDGFTDNSFNLGSDGGLEFSKIFLNNSSSVK